MKTAAALKLIKLRRRFVDEASAIGVAGSVGDGLAAAGGGCEVNGCPSE